MNSYEFICILYIFSLNVTQTFKVKLCLSYMMLVNLNQIRGTQISIVTRVETLPVNIPPEISKWHFSLPVFNC